LSKTPTSYTGRTRQRKTRRNIKAIDRLAQALITVGGLGTILAICGVCVVLVSVVVPLFAPASVSFAGTVKASRSEQPWLHLAVDEHRLLGWSLLKDGVLQSFRLDRDELVSERQLIEPEWLTAASFAIGSDSAALGLADGKVRLARVGVQTRFLSPDELPAKLRTIGQPGHDSLATHGNGVLERAGENQFRLQTLAAEIDEPIDLDPDSDAKVLLLDHVSRSSGAIVCAVTADEKVRVLSITQRRNAITRQVTTTTRGGLLPVDLKKRGAPRQVLLMGSGDSAIVLWRDGYLARFDVRDPSQPKLVEELDVLADNLAEVTAAAFMLGRSTLMIGDSKGMLRAWFRARPADEFGDEVLAEAAAARQQLVCAHEFFLGAPVTALAASTRTRMLAAAMSDGRVEIVHVTSEKQIGDVRLAEGQPIDKIALAPKDDGLIVAAGDQLSRYDLDAPHPEVTLASLFRPVWYEGYDRPMHIWQSSAATQEFEPKLGLWPLVFGTIKATFYSMLFGVPLALLAAIYTSEFLHPRIKSKVKPSIELMASLPSVVLGFVAALVLAPLIEQIVPAVLACFVTLPFAYLLGAYGWQLMPHRLGLSLAKWRIVFIAAMLPVGLLLAWLAGPLVERWLFGGDLIGWLDGQHGSPIGGWMMLLLPATTIGMFIVGREVNSLLRRVGRDWSRLACALVDLLKFLLGLIAAIASAWLLAALLSAIGWDPRGGFVDTYDQRNALIVGFVMGFAIIPLIYTLADDALSTVPEHLRAASLGAGATPWQTATRIVIPTAMSGLFSAMMIGLGRAVGETMIVLMAAGNTPVRQWNIFNGFRTLSANIAVELPEAPVDSTHYRTLFLAALCLFVLTFAVNTMAEVVRLRFRRRAYEL
jgi:phosphate transport system permease protein